MLHREIQLPAAMYKAIPMPVELANVTACHMETCTVLTKVDRVI